MNAKTRESKKARKTLLRINTDDTDQGEIARIAGIAKIEQPKPSVRGELPDAAI
jgi:hypothetical protein